MPELKERKERRQRTLHVAGKTWVTPRLLRVTLNGSDLDGFPEGHESANCKILIDTDAGQRVVRTYTIRSYRQQAQELDIDFFVHDAPGPASYWAVHAQHGDALAIKGPSSPKLVNSECDWVLFAGDMSAMPAIEANLERLNSSVKGFAVLEVVDESDRHAIRKPDGVELIWPVNPHPTVSNSVLTDAVKALTLPEGNGAVWAAGESGAIKILRRYFKDELGIPKHRLYTSGYWQIGLSEDMHQAVKREAANT